MNQLMNLRSSLVAHLTLGAAALALSLAAGGCAGVKMNAPTGTGGTGTTGIGGSIGGPPPINGLESLEVSPASASITLMAAGGGMLSGPPTQFTATGKVNGVSMDITERVTWYADLKGVTVLNGMATANAPGIYTITAKSGGLQSSATLTATFEGSIFDPNFNQTNNNKSVLDSTPSGTTSITYPLDHSLFPSNLAPIYAQMSASGSNAIARLNFHAQGLEVNYYANCVSSDDTNTAATGSPDPLPGGGCYVKMPLTLTQLFIATSEKQDITMTARVFSGGSAPVESQPINVAWANVGLSGGIYYWSTIPNPPKATQDNAPATPPNYILLDKDQTSGTAIYRYDFTNGTPAPTVTWTDDGGPKSTPPYQGAPAAVNNNVGKGHCIGCHSISNDGKYMALTIGGSASDAANTTILDIGQQNLININPSASTDPNSSPTSNWSDYWKKFRVEGVAAENTWGPNNDRMISMFRSKLYQTNVTISGTTGTVTRGGAVIPSWTEYASDPFWAQDGSLFVFTSFDQPDIGTYNTDGLNGDMKRRGQIAIATADMMGVHDDARVLVPRATGVTSFYPSISNDSKLVVFNQSTCGTDPDVNRSDSNTQYGNQSCDGYDDSSATVWIVKPDGGSPIKLTNANGPAGSGNSWPRFSPDKGNFRGDLIYWVAFSSRRAYGSQVNYNVTPLASKPQLWIAAVRTGENIVGDPSWAPVWMPTQNPKQAAPQGNHVPQWVKVIVVIEG
jgi:hypothetical protein